MDPITGIYGGHTYISEYAPDDERFYPWFLSKMQWGAGMARSRNKEFILGEFGCKQVPPGTTVNGREMDTCIYFGTPQERLVGIQLAEAAIAAINGGIYALAYWTFADFPDRFSVSGGVPPGDRYANKWGVFKWSGGDHSARDHYYAYGLLTKFLRGPATVYQVAVNDPRLRVADVRRQGTGAWTLAMINRNSRAVRVSVAIDGTPSPATFRKYVYDPGNIPVNPFGDLQAPAGTVVMESGRWTDTVGPMTLTVYTTAYPDSAPAPVRGLKVEPAGDGTRRLTWQASDAPDFRYYRVYRSEQADFVPDIQAQIGSTIATTFMDEKVEAGREPHYRILAVDASGNASRP
jgi:hypothetical protein